MAFDVFRLLGLSLEVVAVEVGTFASAFSPSAVLITKGAGLVALDVLRVLVGLVAPNMSSLGGSTVAERVRECAFETVLFATEGGGISSSEVFPRREPLREIGGG